MLLHFGGLVDDAAASHWRACSLHIAVEVLEARDQINVPYVYALKLMSDVQ